MTMDREAAWQGIVGYYQQPGAARQLLQLQDRLGVSVTALLTLLWLSATHHGAPTAPAIRALVQSTEAFQRDVLRPMRSAREALRGWEVTPGVSAEDVRQRLLAVELEVERLEQALVLESLGPAEQREAPDDALSDACLALARYCRALEIDLDAEAAQALIHAISVALDDYDGLQISQAWSRAWRSMKAGVS
ncbi:uncharacterized protein (TIGR02444 family) [Natronocella acetinitrilica]|uniref:Uncharacterized protein (TIGR02444 family) n=1 Tax=Natronocella acetinitrilica TaxID=414046 RepID=A0AAE3G863_9GAMM|nr:TIGR02444 family protein [Natronocella acetinitrilica]MCP1676799.1 uncharacterized protein (TIGR02444 family) [Natronocella acetinitrilica]